VQIVIFWKIIQPFNKIQTITCLPCRDSAGLWCWPTALMGELSIEVVDCLSSVKEKILA
jgi:hypothetical protein